jgi:hypothetical protein
LCGRPGGEGVAKMYILNFKKYDFLLSKYVKLLDQINGNSIYNSYFVLESAPGAKKRDLGTLLDVKTKICSLGLVGRNRLYAAATRHGIHVPGRSLTGIPSVWRSR